MPTLAAYRDALESVRLEIEDSSETLTVWTRVQNAVSPIVGLIRERRFAAAVAISAIALVLVWRRFVSGTATERNHSVSLAESGSIETPTVSLAFAGRMGQSAPAENKQESTRTPTVAKPATALRAAETHSTSRLQGEKAARPNIAIPIVSRAMMSGIDSVASKTAIAPNRGIESFALQPLATPTPNRASMFADNQVEAPQHARLIGELPKPPVPSQLANVEGDVRLRFTVDTEGRPVMSSVSVVSSTHQSAYRCGQACDPVDAVRARKNWGARSQGGHRGRSVGICVLFARPVALPTIHRCATSGLYRGPKEMVLSQLAPQLHRDH